MSPDPFFRPDVEFAHESSTEFCELCPQATTGGFCGARIQPDCLRIDSSGVVRVSLSATARTWFETLVQLGEVLHLTRNPVAVLGRLGRMPELKDWRNVVLPRDSFGLFIPNLAEYASLWAVREVSPVGVIHGLEVRDVPASCSSAFCCRRARGASCSSNWRPRINRRPKRRATGFRPTTPGVPADGPRLPEEFRGCECAGIPATGTCAGCPRDSFPNCSRQQPGQNFHSEPPSIIRP